MARTTTIAPMIQMMRFMEQASGGPDQRLSSKRVPRRRQLPLIPCSHPPSGARLWTSYRLISHNALCKTMLWSGRVAQRALPRAAAQLLLRITTINPADRAAHATIL